MSTIGLIGAGHIGSQVARLAVAHGFDVVISNSRGPETLAALVRELGPRARAATPLEAATEGDIVVVTIPLRNIGSVPVEPLAGKVVIDITNPLNATYDGLSVAPGTSAAEILAAVKRRFPAVREPKQ